MVIVKERLKCQHCGNELFDHDDNALTCVLCGRDHDEKGHLIQHPVGGGGFERLDGKFNENYGAR